MELKHIYSISDLKLSFGSKKVLDISTLKFHNGLVYGICGNFGSGKSSLMKVLSGLQKESDGSVLYRGNKFKTNFFGRIKGNEEIEYIHVNMFNTNSTVEKFMNKMFPKKIGKICSKYFKNSLNRRQIWKTNLNKLSDGEKHWLKIIVGAEKDPRVLLIDDYGLHIDPRNEIFLRKSLIKMSSLLGTTLVLSSSNDYFLKQFANVVIYLDNGHVSKIRKGYSRNNSKKNKKR